MKNNSMNPPVTFVGIGGAGIKIIKDLQQMDRRSNTFIEIDGDEDQVYETHWFNSSAILIICAGLGGNTGTDEILKITKNALQQGKSVLPCVTLPFTFEGPRKKNKANDALKTLQQLADETIVINNDDLFQQFDKSEPIYNLFKEANKLLAIQLQQYLSTESSESEDNRSNTIKL